MEIYDRQKNIDMKTDIKVAVVGLGGVGFWVAKFLAMSGVTEFHFFDDDVIEIHNLNRLDIPSGALGKNKASVAKFVIETIRPDAKIKTVPFKFKDTYLNDKVDIIIDCTDKIVSQKTVFDYARTKGIKYMKVGYDGTHVTVANKVAVWGEDEGGYHITPSWVVPAVTIAALATGSILKYFGKEVSADISNLYKVV